MITSYQDGSSSITSSNSRAMTGHICSLVTSMAFSGRHCNRRHQIRESSGTSSSVGELWLTAFKHESQLSEAVCQSRGEGKRKRAGSSSVISEIWWTGWVKGRRIIITLAPDPEPRPQREKVGSGAVDESKNKGVAWHAGRFLQPSTVDRLPGMPHTGKG